MTTPAEAVTTYFAHIQAAQWAAAIQMIGSAQANAWRAAALARTFSMVQLRHDHPGITIVRQSSPADTTGPDPDLVARWKDWPVWGLGVATLGELVQLPAEVLLERLLKFSRCDDDGRISLPWFGTYVQIANVEQITEDVARVKYTYLGQDPHELDEETLNIFQRPWSVTAHRLEGGWVLDVVDETLGPILVSPH
jgi:hypothetical protein